MASPPRLSSANSPPYPQHAPLPNPKKRPSLHLPAGGLTKRRKHTANSVASAASSAHPLRQTSFPPEEIADNEHALRSPSVESDFTGVTGNQSAPAPVGTGKKRGRKSKKRGASGSVRSGGAKINDGSGGGSGGAGERGGDRRRAVSEAHDEDEDDDDHGADLDGPGGAGDEMDRDAERKNLAVLVDAFNPDQADRYEMFRRVKLRKEVVRKITNHVVSQSVPPGVILTINGYTKTFIGSLIEKAREVQEQWASLESPPTMPGNQTATATSVASAAAAAPTSTTTTPITPQSSRIEVDPTDFGAPNTSNQEIYTVHRGEEDDSARPPLDPARLFSEAGDSPAAMKSRDGEKKEKKDASKKRDLGPLLPDHLREALRRYRRDGVGGGTGQGGVSVGLGIQGTAAIRTKGKRLFR